MTPVRLRQGMVFACWLLAWPWLMAKVTGWFALVLVFGGMGLWLAWKGLNRWLEKPALAQGLKGELDKNPWPVLVWLLPLSAMGGVWLWQEALVVWVLAKALMVGLWVIVPVAVGLGFLFKNESRRFLILWGLGGLGVLLLRLLAGPAGARGLDLEPVLMGAWGLLWVLPMAAKKMNLPRWLLLMAWVNVAFHVALLEFYVLPFSGQVARVAQQKGVTLLRHDPAMDFRWSQQGCGESDWWLGSRVFSRSARHTLHHVRGKSRTAFKIGYATTDNGVVDCNLKVVVTGDNGPGGKLHVLSATDGKPLSTTPHSGPAQALTLGFSGLSQLPARGWVAAGKDLAHALVWVNLRDPKRPVAWFFPEHATMQVFCQRALTPCLFSTATGWLHKRWGDSLEHHHATPLGRRALGPDLALDEDRGRVYVSGLTGWVQVRRSKDLSLTRTLRLPMGVRYMVYWPRQKEVWGANFLDGWLYAFSENKRPRRVLFVGRRVRWLNLTRDGRGLTWCAASACYVFSPEKIVSEKITGGAP